MRFLVVLFIFLSHVFSIVAQNTATETFKDARDGEEYATVKIGNQIWMAENLRFFIPGSFLNLDNPSPKYGRLYSWAQVMNVDKKFNSSILGKVQPKYRGICPEGWHLPTDEEWKTLEMTLGLSSTDADKKRWRGTHGTALKSTSMKGSNSSGFNAFAAGGHYAGDRNYDYLGAHAHFWSATETDARKALVRHLHLGGADVGRGEYLKAYGHSCRCVKD